MIDNIYLSYYQAMAFMYRLDEIKRKNPYFNDTISRNFENYAIKRGSELAAVYPQIKLKIIPRANKYIISKSMYNYLCNLTGINPLDKATEKRFVPLIKEAEAIILADSGQED